MGTFFKTFFICLVLAFGFLGYKYFSTESYNSDLFVSKESPVFGTHEDYTESIPETPVKSQDSSNDNSVKKPEEKKYTHTCYFYSVEGKLIPIKRQLTAKPSLESTILLLLKGPTISETKKGIYSEIPANVDLISVRSSDNNALIVDLSSNFGNGGGTQSIENRVKQLSKTIKSYAPNKTIYLYINGKEVEYLGGDGVFIKQPLE